MTITSASIDLSSSENKRKVDLRAIIEDVLDDTDPGAGAADRRNWILWTFLYIIWYEGKNATTRRQDGGGPARGLMQMEPATLHDLVKQYVFGPTSGLIANLAQAAGVSDDDMKNALRDFRDHPEPPQNRWPATSSSNSAHKVETWLVTVDSFGIKLMRYYFKRNSQHAFPPANLGDISNSPQAAQFKAQHSEHWAQWWKKQFLGSPTETPQQERDRKKGDFEQRARHLDTV